VSEVKRFRADHRHVVETEFDDAQFVGVADFDRVTAERDAALGREAECQRQLGERWKDIDAMKTSLEAVTFNLSKTDKVALALQALLTAADERADVLETEVARLNRVKLSLKELADSRADNCSVYRQHLTVALALAEKVRDASLGMQRKFLADLIDHLHQSGAALKPAEGGGDE
jgi:hypothetical protein